jgi:hypothetical protein
MAVAGDSVGGCMTAALALMAKERRDVRFVHQSMPRRRCKTHSGLSANQTRVAARAHTSVRAARGMVAAFLELQGPWQD